MQALAAPKRQAAVKKVKVASPPVSKVARGRTSFTEVRIVSFDGRRQIITSFRQVTQAQPLERIALVKQGVPANWVAVMASRMALDRGQLLKTLGLPRATIDRKASSGKPLSTEESERVLGMARLVGQVQSMVEDAGNPQGFDAGKWLAKWLETPLPAFGGRKPAEVMDTAEGQALVSQWLARVTSGAYA